jgi:hypothetical protein
VTIDNMSVRPITFVTGNIKKLEEVTAILGSNSLINVLFYVKSFVGRSCTNKCVQ